MTNKTRLNNHLKKREIKERTEIVQGEIVELQTLIGNELESYYMRTKNLSEDALTMFWKPKVAATNAQDGHDMIDAAVDGYKNVLESLTQGYNHVQSANDTFKESDWLELKDKINGQLKAIETISQFTEYNGQVLINGEYLSSTRQPSANFLVGVKPSDVVSFTPKNMHPSVLGYVVLDEPIIADDGITSVDEVYIDHFSKNGHDGVSLSISTTQIATVAMKSINQAIAYVKETLSDSNLIQDDLLRIKGFMEQKADKGASFLQKFKNDRALELAQELEDLEGQLELLGTMER